MAEVEVSGVNRMLCEWHRDLAEGSYRPAPTRRRDIPEPAGWVRPVGTPTVRDQVVQAAAKIVCEPTFEADSLGCWYGYGPGKSATDPEEAIQAGVSKGYAWASEVDIPDFFGSIDHDVVMGLVERHVSGRRGLKLPLGRLQAGAMVGGRYRETGFAAPQGGVLSPLLPSTVMLASGRVVGRH